MRDVTSGTQLPTFALPAPERSGLPSAFALLPEELAALGHPGDAAHLFGRLQRPGSWEGGAPALGRRTRAFLEAHADLGLPTLVEQHPSADGATRCVLQSADGHLFEAVHMPRATTNPRTTLCISSQVGCAMGCTFCATGSMGIVRNLSAGEIVGQVLALTSALGPARGHALNLVFMGMGEPLHNLAHLCRALRVLCSPAGLGIAPARITVSTSGLVPGIEALGRAAPRPLLAVSVNATTDEARSAIMPVNRAYPLARLRQALAGWPLRPKERITIEYVMIAGDNDRDDDAERLASFVQGLSCHVNLIPMNEHDKSSAKRPSDERITAFHARLRAAGVRVLVRNSRGRDVGGACGQLVQLSSRPRRGRLESCTS